MDKQISIVVRTQFEFAHLFAQAPQEVAFLRHLHRHIFHVELEAVVQHDDRELEFIVVKRRLEQFIECTKKYWPETISCEQIASRISEWFCNEFGQRDVTVSVFEDLENGAKVRCIVKE